MPQIGATATEEPDLAAFECALEGAGVHVAQHEHLAGVHVLRDCGHETLFVEFDFCGHDFHPYYLDPATVMVSIILTPLS